MLERWKPHEINYNDLKIERALVRWPRPSGGMRLRWVDLGMPKISPELANSIIYLFATNPKSGEIEGPVGTGFVVCRGYKNPPTSKRHYYAVSNRHVVHNFVGDIIRINTKDGASRPIETQPTEWLFREIGDDLAVTDITDQINIASDEISAIEETVFADEKLISDYNITFGEDVFMLGLFVDHDGGKRNVPSARFGNVSRLANKNNKVKQPHGQVRPSHLIDMRSRTGFSGSPVFVYRTHASDLTNEFNESINEAGPGGVFNIFTGRDHFIQLFGVHCGQFQEIFKIKEDKVVAAESEPVANSMGDSDRNLVIKSGDKLYIPSSMTIVVPAWRISEILDHEDFEVMRRKREYDDDDTSIPEPEVVISSASPAAPHANDESPTHLEDFSRLVDVAARKRPQGDQP